MVGLHWFNPVPVLKLVELIRPLQASQQSVDKAKAFAEACGKTVCTAADVPGCVVLLLLGVLTDGARADNR